MFLFPFVTQFAEPQGFWRSACNPSFRFRQARPVCSPPGLNGVSPVVVTPEAPGPGACSFEPVLFPQPRVVPFHPHYTMTGACDSGARDGCYEFGNLDAPCRLPSGGVSSYGWRDVTFLASSIPRVWPLDFCA